MKKLPLLVNCASFFISLHEFFFSEKAEEKKSREIQDTFFKKYFPCLWLWILKVRYLFEILTHRGSSKPFMDWFKCSSQFISNFSFSFIGWIRVFRNLSLQNGYFVIRVFCKSSCSRVFSQFGYVQKFIPFFFSVLSSLSEPCDNLKVIVAIK